MSGIAEYIKFSRATRAAAIFLFLGIFLLWWKLFGESGAEVGSISHKATIEQSDNISYTARLSNGRLVRVPHAGSFSIGEEVTILERSFEEGDVEFSISPELTYLSDN